MEIVERVMEEHYAGGGTVHPSDHLLKLTELCELFKAAGLLRENTMKKLFPLSLKDKQKSGMSYWMILIIRSGRSLSLSFTLTFILLMKCI